MSYTSKSPEKKSVSLPALLALKSRAGLIGAEKAWMGEYCRRIMQLNFLAD
jgi:hypothetical protein